MLKVTNSLILNHFLNGARVKEVQEVLKTSYDIMLSHKENSAVK